MYASVYTAEVPIACELALTEVGNPRSGLMSMAVTLWWPVELSMSYRMSQRLAVRVQVSSVCLDFII